jgi:hypothetical protein
MSTLWFRLSLCALGLSVLAAQEVRLSGVVVDQAGLPVDGALVRLLGADLTAVTGSDGAWSISEGHARAVFPNRVKSTSRIEWGGPGKPLRVTVGLLTWVTVIGYDASGRQVTRQAFPCRGETDCKVSIPQEVTLLSIVSQACDRVVYRITAGNPQLVFSTCEGAIPVADVDGYVDLLAVEHYGHQASGAKVTSWTETEAVNHIVLQEDHPSTIIVDPGSWPGVQATLTGGETVLFKDGDYGVLKLPAETGYATRVTLRAAPEAKPQWEHVSIGASSDNTDGTGDTRLCLDGFIVRDGISIAGSRWIDIRNCSVQKAGDIIGSMKNIEKTAISFRESRGIWIEGCDVSHAGNGIGGWGNHIVYRKNHVHDLSQDGLHYLGGHDFLCEYNDVHDMEDGAYDSEKKDKPWGMHCDAIQMYPIWGNDEPRNWLADCTFRGNRFYRPEAMGWMIQSKTQNQLKRFLFENNITTAVPGYMFHFKDSCDGVVFRFNSFLIPDEGYQYKGIFDRSFNTASALNWVALCSWGNQTTFVEVYGNIMGGGADFDGSFLKRCDNNIYFTHGAPRRKVPLGPGERVVGQQPFENWQNIDATPSAASGAIACGLNLGENPSDRHLVPLPVYDATGRPRSKQVSIGAIDVHATAPQAAVIEGKRSAKPASRAKATLTTVEAQVESAWDQRLRSALISHGRGTFQSHLTGDNAVIEAVASDGLLTVRFAGRGTMDLPWERLTAAEKVDLARSGIPDAQESRVVQIFYLLSIGRTADADALIAVTGREGQAVRALFSPATQGATE